MNKKNIVYDKALDFSVRVVNLYNFLDQKGAAAVMSKQLLRCGTSIGANISESISAESDLDFIHKLAIAQKEAEETLYWLVLLKRTNFLTEVQYSSMNQDCVEIKKLLTSIIVTSKQKKNNYATHEANVKISICHACSSHTMIHI